MHRLTQKSGQRQRCYESGDGKNHWLPIHFSRAARFGKHHLWRHQYNDAAGFMKTYHPTRHASRHHQAGVAAIEFALVASLFFTVLLGIMEMGRVLFYWNSAAEATRLGARIAVVCDLNDAD